MNHTIFEGNIKPQNIRIHYKGVQIFTNNSATACEFFFIASNDKVSTKKVLEMNCESLKQIQVANRILE